ERLLSSLNGNDDLAARFHALHLLACVAFSAQRYAESRTLHEEVLSMSRAIGFAGGSGSSLFDIGMIDHAQGDLASARRRWCEAREAYQRGGYSDRLPIVDAALASLSPSQRDDVPDTDDAD